MRSPRSSWLTSCKGVLAQTRRHSLICSLMKIRHVVVAINKIDLVSYAKKRFDQIAADYMAFAAQLGFSSIVPIPLLALRRQRDETVHQHALVSRAIAPGRLETIDVDSAWRTSHSVSLYNGLTGPISISRLCRHGDVGYHQGDPIVVAASGRSTWGSRNCWSMKLLASVHMGDAITMDIDR